MRIEVIAAIGRNGELGKEGKLPWHLPADLKYFKQVTTGQVVVMGRKTYESLPNQLLDRTIIVLTTQNYKVDAPNVLVFNSVGEVLHYAYLHKVETLYVAGGGQIYKHFLPLADVLHLTEVSQSYDADTYFEWNPIDWVDKRFTVYPAVDNIPLFTITYYERK